MYKQPTNKHRVLAMKDKFENKICNNNVQNMSIILSEIKSTNQRVFLNNNNATSECTNSNIVPYLPKQINGLPKRIIKRSEAFRRDKNSSDSISSFQRNLSPRTSCRTNNIDDKIKLFDNSNTNQPLQRSGSFSDLYSTPRRKGNISKDLESKSSKSAISKKDFKIDQCDNPIQNTAEEESPENEDFSCENVKKLTSFKKEIMNKHLESHLDCKSLQETFKEALKKPLPAGPAPSKPPRTFLYSPNSKFNGQREINTVNNVPKEEKPPILRKEYLIKKEKSKLIKSDPKYMLDKLETVLKNNRMKFKRQERIDISFTSEDDIETESPALDKKMSILKEPACNVNLTFEGKSEEIGGTLLSAVRTFKSEKSPREKKWEPIYAEPFHHNKIKNERSNTNRNSLYYMSSPVVLVNKEQSFDFKD